MSREWKPGDVALVMRDSNEVRAMRYSTGSEQGWRRPQYGAWHDGTGYASDFFDPDEGTEPRPLIVLDLSPHEVMRALEALRGSRGMVAMAVADDLEAAAQPPRPDEPQGLGAVVEDESGDTWTRADKGGVPWFLTAKGGNGGRCEWARWSDIKAVKVLSEGVTA